MGFATGTHGMGIEHLGGMGMETGLASALTLGQTDTGAGIGILALVLIGVALFLVIFVGMFFAARISGLDIRKRLS